MLITGCPPLLHPLAARWGSTLPGQSFSLRPLAAYGKHAMLCGGFPLLLHFLATHWGSALPGWCDPLHTLTAHMRRALLIGSPPPFPLLVVARVKSALPFRVSLFLGLVLRLDAHKERALPVLFSCPHSPPVSSIDGIYPFSITTK